MSDKEEEWKPSGRPQSTMALSLATTLDDAFMLNSDVDNLSNSIHYKQQMVTLQNRELEALEARIREAENRLKSENAQGFSNESSHTDKPHQSQTADRSENTEKSHAAQFSSSSSGSHPSDEDSTGSASSAAGRPSPRYYRDGGGREVEEGQNGKEPQF